MSYLANPNIKLPHGITYILDGMVYRVNRYEITTTDANGQDSTVDVEKHDVVCPLSVFAELERIRKKDST
jgi:hypothetical protein